MPELDDLWTAVNKGQANEENFKKIEDILKKKPELVNSVKPGVSKNPIPLLRALIAKKYPETFLQKIITITPAKSSLPSIDYNFKEDDESQGTQRETLIRHTDLNLITTALNNPDFLYSKNENAYSVAAKVRKKFNDDYKKYEKTVPEAASIFLDKIKKLDESILPILYKATSEYAASKKDKTLLTDINNERAKLMQEEESKKISKPQANINRNSMFQDLKDLKEAESRLHKLRMENETNKEKIYSDAAKGRSDRLNTAYTLTKK